MGIDICSQCRFEPTQATWRKSTKWEHGLARLNRQAIEFAVAPYKGNISLDAKIVVDGEVICPLDVAILFGAIDSTGREMDLDAIGQDSHGAIDEKEP